MEDKNEVISYYDTIAGEYDESRFSNSYGRFIDAEERRILDKIIDVSSGRKRLEIACGTGRLTNYATHGLDASNEMMAYARKRHPEVEFTHASATATGFADEEFDTVYTFHLLMHLSVEDIRQIFKEVHRILKPGGHFIMDIPSQKRRNLLHHKQQSWHGGTELSTADLLEIAKGMFDCKASHGIMMLPVHKLPEGIRKPLVGFDFFMANGWLKEYSSYLVYDFIKK